ncbi:MAG: hypothetical protein ACRCYQ_06425 [Nocardioides sp.]
MHPIPMAVEPSEPIKVVLNLKRQGIAGGTCTVLVRDITYGDAPTLEAEAAYTFDELSSDQLRLAPELEISLDKLEEALAGRRELGLEVTVRFGDGTLLAPGDLVNEFELIITEESLANGFDVLLTPVAQVVLDPHVQMKTDSHSDDQSGRGVDSGIFSQNSQILRQSSDQLSTILNNEE